MIEKKLILCGILAIAIGIATIVPLEYMMAAQAQEATPDKAWSNLNVTYAYWNVNNDFTNYTGSFYCSAYNALANVTVDSNALNNANARIAYYQLQVSSDKGPIENLTYYVGIAKTGELINIYNTTLFFANGNTYSTNVTSGGMFVNDMGNTTSYYGIISGSNLGTISNAVPQTVTQLQNANKLYIDVTRLCSFTFSGNTTTVTTGNSQVIQHIELTKAGNGFVYGTYVDGTVPFPMEGPSTTSASAPSLQATFAPNNEP